MKETALEDLARLVEGEIVGRRKCVTGANSLESAGPDEITFSEGTGHQEKARASRAGVIVTETPIEGSEATFILVPRPRIAFAAILRHFFSPTPAWSGIHPTAVIAQDAQLDEDVHIGPFVTIGCGTTIGRGSRVAAHASIGARCVLGEGVDIRSQVAIEDDTRIGNRVTIHPGSVIGSEGFGYVQNEGRNEKVPQLGHVEIADDVEIGANVTIDRAAFGATRIGEDTKIDNLVQIGHNVQIGSHTIIISQVGISGSTKVGSYCMIGGQVGIVGHIDITDQVMIGAQSGVGQSVRKKGVISGSPAFDHASNLRSQAVFARLPAMKKELRRLSRELEELRHRLGES